MADDADTSRAVIIQDGVEARKSLIDGAGQGLFALKTFRNRNVICEYVGKVYANADAWKLNDKSYLMKLGDGKYVDARESVNVLARYINDCRDKNRYNVVFDKRPHENRALVVAIRDITVGEELYVDYGRFYWLAYNMLHPDQPVHAVK